MGDDRPYVIHSATKITLSALARELARENGMTDVQMAKHILEQENLRASGETQREGEN